MQLIREKRYKFSAKELDNETNYDYFGARYYDNDLSQWLSVNFTIGYIKGEELFGNASLRVGSGVDISWGIGFSYGNYVETGKPSSSWFTGAGTYQNFGSVINFSSFQNISSNFGNLNIGDKWRVGTLNICLGSKTLLGGSTGVSLTTKPLK